MDGLDERGRKNKVKWFYGGAGDSGKTEPGKGEEREKSSQKNQRNKH